MAISLTEIYSDPLNEDKYVKFLYKLLGQRQSYQNISHSNMPLYNTHKLFVQSRPYLKWWVIVVDDLLVGAMYLTREYEIGIFLDNKQTGKGFGGEALEQMLGGLRGRPVLANINPNNTRSIEFFKRHGFERLSTTVNKGTVIQETYSREY
jgi:RimJ/RimL family protein N-acetyltransferase